MCYDVKVPDKNKLTKTIDCVQCQRQCRTPRHYRQHFISAHREERPFECQSEFHKCDLKFKHNYDVQQHMKRIHANDDQKGPHLCQECGNTFANEARMKMHVALIHEKKPINDLVKESKDYICSDCGKTFPSQKHLKQHLRLMHKEEPDTISCLACKQEFTLAEEYDKHVQESHEDIPNIGQYKCEKCDVTFCLTRILDWHYLKVHNEKIHTCHICMKGLSLSSSLINHIKLVHKFHQRKKYMHCVFCDNWDGEGTLMDHVKAFHSNEEMPFCCEQCEYKTFTMQLLKIHVKTQHLSKEQFQCDQCEFVTSYKYGLERHINHVHLKVKAFQCDMCPKAVKDKRTLQRHLVTKHNLVLSAKEMDQVNRDLNKSQTIKVVEAKCDTCNLSFETEDSFDEHFRKCHKNESELNFNCNRCDSSWEAAKTLHFHLYNSHNVKDGPCDICGTILKNSYHIERHKKTVHFKIKDFKCDHCDRTFSLKNELENHIQSIHIKIAKFFCEQCDYKTFHQKGLNVHIKMHHMKDAFKCKQCDFACNSPKILKTHNKKNHF